MRPSLNGRRLGRVLGGALIVGGLVMSFAGVASAKVTANPTGPNAVVISNNFAAYPTVTPPAGCAEGEAFLTGTTYDVARSQIGIDAGADPIVGATTLREDTIGRLYPGDTITMTWVRVRSSGMRRRGNRRVAVPGGEDPLNTSGVHPEAYPVVRRIIEAAKTDIKGLIGNATVLRALSPKNFVDDTFGLPTVTDILRELEKPGRDPRPAFKAAVFMDGVETLNDLKPGMVLEGAVTNVAAFGAFVDIGVHQDGLVHVSAMSKTFVQDPREVVKPGDIVRVKILEVDIPRKRVALTLRLDDELGPRTDRAGTAAPRNDSVRPASRGPSRSAAPTRRVKQGGGALADALRRAGLAEKRK